MKRSYFFPALAFASILVGCGSQATVGGGPNPVAPTGAPTGSPTGAPTGSPSGVPTGSPTGIPTGSPSGAPSVGPSGSVTPTPTAVPTRTPVPTPSPTPIPSATLPGHPPQPTGTPEGGTTPAPGASAPVYHPVTNGNKLVFIGRITTTYARPNQSPSPEPTQTTVDNVTQDMTVANPATFNGSTAVDFETDERDDQTAPAPETFTSQGDNYYAFSNNIYTGNFSNLGYTSGDDTGYSVSVTNGSGNGLVDILPEVSGAIWTNNAAASIATKSNDGESSSDSINADGSYTDTINYQNVGASGPTTTAVVKSMSDGSGSYNTPRLGTDRAYNYMYTVTAPSTAGPTGTITETTVIPPAAETTDAPTTSTTAIPNWIPPAALPGKLYTESDQDLGAKPLPASCPVGSAFAQSVNEIEAVKQNVDPMLGILENTTTDYYDDANVGPVCIVIHDVQTDYYDFSGQNGVGYFSGVPQQITTVDEVLYLSEATLNAVRRSLSRFQVRQGLSINVAAAQARFAAGRIEQRARLLHTFLSTYRGHGKAFASHRGIL